MKLQVRAAGRGPAKIVALYCQNVNDFEDANCMNARLVELDGLRGIAIALVVLFHFGFFPPGWIGVQLFFVLSGYLISEILLTEKEKPFPTYLARFYWRRSLRIFPLYFFYLISMSVLFAATGEPRSFEIDWPFLVTYTTNFGRLRASDVGEAFTHLWSLAIEEQFYLLWPLAVYFCPLASLKRIILAVIFLSPIARAILYFAMRYMGYDEEFVGRAIYVLPFTQFDAFAFGAAIAVWKLQDFPYPRRLILAVGLLAALLGAAVILHQHFAYRAAFKASLGYQMYVLAGNGFVWAYSLLDLLSAAAVICAIQKLPAVGFLRNSVLSRTGVISYGIYVYHVPALLGLKWLLGDFAQNHSVATFFVYVGVVFVISELSFRFLEKPVLSMRNSGNRTVSGIVVPQR
jgi:peptidoglycan/LPS O-acetylase OafA/YrhL